MRRAAIVVVAGALLAGCVSIRWESADDWHHFSVYPITAATNTVWLSVGPPDAETGRITETGAERNDRRWWVLHDGPAVTDVELLALWRGHTRWMDGGGQRGQVLRAQQRSDGTTTGYVVWHDYVYAQDHIVHTAVWSRGPGGDFSFTYLGSASFDFLKRVALVPASSRSGGVATLTVPTGHGIRVGDAISVDVTDASFDGVHEVIAADGTSVRYADAGPDTLLGGAGTAQNLDGVPPYWVRTRLVRETIAIKVWPAGDDEPAWDDATHVRVFEDAQHVGPAGAGRVAIYAGHLRDGGWVEYGRLEGDAIAPGSPAPEPTQPTAADLHARLTLLGDPGLPAVAAGSLP